MPWLPTIRRVPRRPDSDAALLTRYVERYDNEAFALLVARHADLVYRVCRGVLRDAHDAEDATQSTFLTLARAAGAVRQRDSLASFLHGTALRTAQTLRTRRSRADRRERIAARSEADSRDPLGELTVREARELLHRELDRLPEQYKSPLVLVYFEGQSHDEAARQLGWSSTVFRGRLERARQALAARLARHKLTLSAALALTALTLDAPAGLAATIAAAAAPAGHAAPMPAAPLALKAGLVAAAGVAAVVSVAALAPPHAPLASPPPLVAAPPDRGWHYHTGQVVAATEEGLFWLHPTGGAAFKLAEATQFPPTRFRLAPDGRVVALGLVAPGGDQQFVTHRFVGDPSRYRCYLTPPTTYTFFWTRDSARLVSSDPRGITNVFGENAMDEWHVAHGHQLLDAAWGEKVLLAATGDHELMLIDQTQFPVTQAAGTPTLLLAGLTAETAPTWRLSPDGRFAAGLTPADSGNRVAMIDLPTRKLTALPDSAAGAFLGWSPDSQAVLYARPAGAAKGLGPLVAQRLGDAPRVRPPAAGPPVLWADWR